MAYGMSEEYEYTLSFKTVADYYLNSDAAYKYTQLQVQVMILWVSHVFTQEDHDCVAQCQILNHYYPLRLLRPHLCVKAFSIRGD